MKIIRRSSLISLIWIIIWLGLLGGTVYYLTYQSVNMLSAQINPVIEKKQNDLTNEALVLNQINRFFNDTKEYFLPMLAGLFVLTGLLIWMFIRMTLSRAAKKIEFVLNKPKKPQKKSLDKIHVKAPTKEDKKQEKILYSLHLLSLLQREGRLLDFLEEDLDDYDDEQIGAAVRNIHENSKKVIHKYLAPKCILDEEEGDEITINPGFSPEEIKLTGNISGDPPFKGILRHKGWRSGRFDMPSISTSKKSEIIAPAEVEIE